jgi:hypothetical protein
MGIRFHCPNGHKLNVKTFLAGKRGICPHCGAKFEIPAESTVSSAPPPLVAGAGATSAAKPNQAAAMLVAAHALQPATVTVGAAISPVAVQAAAISAMPSEPNSAPSGAAHLPSAPVAVTVPGANVPPLPVVTPVAATPPDPIAEAPNAVWYVRPAAGGQFGPAGGEVMRQWLSQRRVGADSLVWREGWPEWKRAAATFPSLAVATPPSPGPMTAGPVPATAPIPRMDDDWMEAIVENKPAHLPKARPKSTRANNLILVISAIIVLIGAVVAGCLIYTAIRHANRDNPSPPAAPAAP